MSTNADLIAEARQWARMNWREQLADLLSRLADALEAAEAEIARLNERLSEAIAFESPNFLHPALRRRMEARAALAQPTPPEAKSE